LPHWQLVLQVKKLVLNIHLCRVLSPHKWSCTYWTCCVEWWTCHHCANCFYSSWKCCGI